MDVKNYYNNFLILRTFEEILFELSKQLFGNTMSCSLKFRDGEEKSISIPIINKHLSILGLKDISVSCASSDNHAQTSTLSIIFDGGKHYYIDFFQLLEKLFPDLDLDPYKINFKNQCERLLDPRTPSIQSEKNSVDSAKKTIEGHSKFIWVLPGMISLILLFGLIYTAYIFKQTTQEIRSDLTIPTESVLLKRANLLNHMENEFNKQGKIKTVALVGIGGAGKTTLARQYARLQKSSLVWEINAETFGGFIHSHENLSYALAKTEQDKKSLKEINEIKNNEEGEDRIVSFVKAKLKSHSNWILIYDNLESFKDIQKYFPSEPEIWGNGKIIITTRDTNIHNNSYIKNTLHIGELNPEEKLQIFMNITSKGNNTQITSTKEEIKAFLNELPPFPLDISTASYYLKSTNISYEDYLGYLKNFNKDFELMQESILKEANQYTKTRSGIVVLSIKNIINIHKEFEQLLLFISLLDSHSIPKKLLNKFKGDIVTDNFIYNLKRYSLITTESQTSPSKISASHSIAAHKS